jgi:hypothetical protein
MTHEETLRAVLMFARRIIAHPHKAVGLAEHIERIARESGAVSPGLLRADTPPLEFNPANAPSCRKHRVYKLVAAHYYCPECYKAGEATVGPVSATLDEAEETRSLLLSTVDNFKSITAPCPACVSERGTVDPECRYCRGTGRKLRDDARRTP